MEISSGLIIAGIIGLIAGIVIISLINKNKSLSLLSDAKKEAEKIKIDYDKKEREDYRKELTFTIDPVDAKDFDDAISFKKENNEIQIKSLEFFRFLVSKKYSIDQNLIASKFDIADYKSIKKNSK